MGLHTARSIAVPELDVSVSETRACCAWLCFLSSRVLRVCRLLLRTAGPPHAARGAHVRDPSGGFGRTILTSEAIKLTWAREPCPNSFPKCASRAINALVASPQHACDQRSGGDRSCSALRGQGNPGAPLTGRGQTAHRPDGRTAAPPPHGRFDGWGYEYEKFAPHCRQTSSVAPSVPLRHSRGLGLGDRWGIRILRCRFGRTRTADGPDRRRERTVPQKHMAGQVEATEKRRKGRSRATRKGGESESPEAELD
jgi:hypothetical protein